LYSIPDRCSRTCAEVPQYAATQPSETKTNASASGPVPAARGNRARIADHSFRSIVAPAPYLLRYACRPEPPAPISRQTTQIKPSASAQIAGARFISAGQGKLGALILQTLRENVNTDFNVESARGKGMRVTITFVHKPPLNRPN
jgi:hypothetical protein